MKEQQRCQESKINLYITDLRESDSYLYLITFYLSQYSLQILLEQDFLLHWQSFGFE